MSLGIQSQKCVQLDIKLDLGHPWRSENNGAVDGQAKVAQTLIALVDPDIPTTDAAQFIHSSTMHALDPTGGRGRTPIKLQS